MKRLFAFFFLIMISCSSEKPREKDFDANQKPLVVAVNYPLHYFAQRIGGDLIQAQFPVPGNIDPAFWEPTVEDVQLFQQADLILDNGADYAKWMKQVSLPNSRIMDVSSDFTERLISVDGSVSHSHGPEGEHSHGELAFTIWLDFQLANQQALAIVESLTKLLPDQEAELKTNFESLESDLLELHRSALELTDRIKGRIFFASHPVYQYLGSGYGFELISEHWEPDAMPGSEYLEGFQGKLAEYKPRVMLWEAEPLPEMRKWLAENEVNIVVFETCGNQPGSGNFLAVMKGNIEALKAATVDMKPVMGHD